jgi:hypothetical protein
LSATTTFLSGISETLKECLLEEQEYDPLIIKSPRLKDSILKIFFIVLFFKFFIL